jgi:hypothetical protein
MRKGSRRITINPHGSVISVPFIRGLLRQAGITPEDWGRAE